MRVSVVVPLYNKADYLVRTLDSISRQTFADFEAIVVDDGSTDGSRELALQYPDPRFRVVTQPNAGPGAARNLGIVEAQGEIVAFLDADDCWLPEYLQSSVELLDRSGPDVVSVTSGYMERPADMTRVEMWRRRGITDGVHRLTPEAPDHALAQGVAYMSCCTTVARKSALQRWGGFYSRDNCRYAEDAALWLKILLNEAVCFQLRPLVHIDRQAAQLSGNFSGPRPIEPFLLDPGDIERVCRPEWLPLLRRYYARCACKTAVILGCWGEVDRARALVDRFVRLRDVNPLYFMLARLACNPVAARLFCRLFRRAIAGGSSRRGRIWNRLP